MTDDQFKKLQEEAETILKRVEAGFPTEDEALRRACLEEVSAHARSNTPKR
jgi:hypothetical protein